jgi:hypothetical protein
MIGTDFIGSCISNYHTITATDPPPRNVQWMVLYQIYVFDADLKSNMAARVHNVFSLAEIFKILLSETTKSNEL